MDAFLEGLSELNLNLSTVKTLQNKLEVEGLP
jgi:hypothetical protein